MKKVVCFMLAILAGTLCLQAQQDTLRLEDFDGPVATFIKREPGILTAVQFQVNVPSDTVYGEFERGKLLPFVLSDTVALQVYNYEGDNTFLYDTIRVYSRHPERITHVVNNGGGFTYADVSRLENLYYLDLQHNYLQSLDVTHNENLLFLMLYGTNEISELDVTQNTKLEHLNVEMLPLEELDVTHNKNLLHLNIGGTKMKEINLDSNLNLYELLASNCELTELKTDKFPNLQYLSVSYSPISEIDVTKNPNLYQLYATGMEGDPVTYIDVTQNPKLQIFFAMNNALERCDFSNNPDLFSVYISQNNLSELDLSNNPAMIELSIWRNNLRFSTMPPIELSYYSWNPQNAMPIGEHYEVGEPIDLSSEAVVSDVRTVFEWKTGDKYPYVTLLEGVDYEIENGVTTFLRAQPDSVFCEMTNEFFGSTSITTTWATIGSVASEKNGEVASRVWVEDGMIQVDVAEDMKAEIFDIRGVRIYGPATVCGHGEFDVPSAGLYIVRLSRNGFVSTEKVAVL